MNWEKKELKINEINNQACYETFEHAVSLYVKKRHGDEVVV